MRTSQNRAAALLPLWVEQAEIAYRYVGSERAEEVLREGLHYVAVRCEIEASPLAPAAKSLAVRVADLGLTADARVALRRAELESLTRRAGIAARAA